MAYIIYSVIIVSLVLGAMIFLAFKSDSIALEPEDLAELLKSCDSCINIKIRYQVGSEPIGERIDRRGSS